MTVFFVVVCVLFGYLAWATFRDEPVQLEADLNAVKTEQRARKQKAPAPSRAGLLLRIVLAATATGSGVPYKIGLAALLSEAVANAVFGLWVLAFVL